MKSRFFLVISIVLFIFSCNQFVNLGDKSAGSADNTEGLPDEIYENDNPGSEENTGNYDDWNEDGKDYEEGANEPEYSDDQNAPSGDYPDEDYSDSNSDNEDPQATNPDTGNPNETSDDEDEAYIFPESDPFPEGFSNIICECGEAPQYQPVCCDGKISVFNKCFANCYAINSDGKICSVSETGLCDEYEKTDDDAEETPENDTEEDDQDAEITDDSDTELPDSDEIVIENECGCYPEEEPAIFRCGEDSFFVTSCLANCFCENPEKIF